MKTNQLLQFLLTFINASGLDSEYIFIKYIQLLKFRTPKTLVLQDKKN